jgi:hypothetical protein
MQARPYFVVERQPPAAVDDSTFSDGLASATSDVLIGGAVESDGAARAASLLAEMV